MSGHSGCLLAIVFKSIHTVNSVDFLLVSESIPLESQVITEQEDSSYVTFDEACAA